MNRCNSTILIAHNVCVASLESSKLTLSKRLVTPKRAFRERNRSSNMYEDDNFDVKYPINY